jgi:hypothetical protein
MIAVSAGNGNRGDEDAWGMMRCFAHKGPHPPVDGLLNVAPIIEFNTKQQ